MLVCTKCNSTQENGQFCANCGGELVPQEGAEEAAATQQTTAEPNQGQTQQPNPTVEKAKKELGNYWNFILDYIKAPTKGLNAPSNLLIFGIITLALYAITYSLSNYFVANRAYRDLAGFFGASESIPFFETFFQDLLLIIVLILAGIVSAFIMMKVAKVNISFQDVVTQVGTLSTPYLAVNLLAIITSLAGLIVFTSTLLLVGFFLLIVITPTLLVFEKTTQANVDGQRYYYSIGTVLLIFLFNYIVFRFIFESIVSDIPFLDFF